MKGGLSAILLCLRRLISCYSFHLLAAFRGGSELLTVKLLLICMVSNGSCNTQPIHESWLENRTKACPRSGKSKAMAASCPMY